MEEEIKQETLALPQVSIVFKPLNLGTQFQQGGDLVEIPDVLTKYKMLAVCFGASWCIITKDFLKHLTAFYEEINIEEKELQIVFVAMEKTEDDYKKFTRGMPWLCIPFSDIRITDLKEFYKVRSLPQVMALQLSGDPIAAINGRQDICRGGEDTFNKWVEFKAEI